MIFPRSQMAADLAVAQVEYRSQGTKTDRLRDNVTKLRGDGSQGGGNQSAYLLRRSARDNPNSLTLPLCILPPCDKCTCHTPSPHSMANPTNPRPSPNPPHTLPTWPPHPPDSRAARAESLSPHPTTSKQQGSHQHSSEPAVRSEEVDPRAASRSLGYGTGCRSFLRPRSRGVSARAHHPPSTSHFAGEEDMVYGREHG
jgi:hypothetical protein